MQAAMNPLLSILGAGPAEASGARALSGDTAKSGFPQLLTNLFQGGSNAIDAEEIAGDLFAQVPALTSDLANALSELQQIAEGEGLPSEVLDVLQEGIATLSKLVEQLQDAVGIVGGLSPIMMPSDGAIAIVLQPEFAVDPKAGALGGLSALFMSIQKATQGLVTDLAPLAAGQRGTQFDALAALQNRLLNAGQSLRSLVATDVPGRHPVSLVMSLDETTGRLGEPSTFTAATADSEKAAVSLIASNMGQAPAQKTPGSFDLPKEFLPVANSELGAVGANVSELTEINRQTVSQQMARPDAPQAKFSQAIVNQMRSVDFQEGVTKVALSPKGLGTIELEMKTNSDGSLSVVVRAENAHVLNSLRDERDLLGQIIGQSGEASVDFQEFTSDQGQEFGEQSGSAAIGFGAGDTEEAGGVDDAIADQNQRRGTIGNGQLDLMT